MSKPNLPAGWKLRKYASGIYDCRADDFAVMRNRNGKWRLYHQGKDTGHNFATVAEAIGYAEDARLVG
jgi:hypothetical protein